MSAETSRDRIATAIDIASANCLIGVAGIIRDLAAERDAATARAEAAEEARDNLRIALDGCCIDLQQTEAQRDAATAERDALRGALETARSLIDRHMGDTDPQDPDHPLLRACQAISAAIASAKEPSA